MIVSTDDGEPESDGVVVRGSIEDFDIAKPKPKDVMLVLEVSNSSLADDRGVKLRSYARAAIVYYWIINLIDRQVEVHTQADAVADVPVYLDRQVLGPDQLVALVIDGQLLGQIPVADLLPVQTVDTD